jgi:hypothetical protein
MTLNPVSLDEFDYDKQPTNIIASAIAGNIIRALGNFVYARELGLVSGEDGGSIWWQVNPVFPMALLSVSKKG